MGMLIPSLGVITLFYAVMSSPFFYPLTWMEDEPFSIWARYLLLPGLLGWLSILGYEFYKMGKETLEEL